MRYLAGLVAVSMVLSGAVIARADWFSDTGYYTLRSELGANLPTGAGVKVVQVEFPLDYPTDTQYLPYPALTGFPDFDPNANGGVAKVFTDYSAAAHPTAQQSGHAFYVARSYYGNTVSLAPGISNVGVYEANNWMSSFLNFGAYGSSTAPNSYGDARVANYSWITGFSPANPWTVDLLHRIDYLTNNSDVIQVAAVPNAGTPAYPVFANAFNVLMVGRIDGQHTPGTATTGITDSQNLYNTSRTRPDVVASSSGDLASYTAPIVSGGVAALIQAVHGHPSWSLNRSYTPAGGAGYVVYDGERSQVMKAVVMAGASRTAIAAYNATTVNGLDATYGAGLFNFHDSYHILAGGERDPSSTVPMGRRMDLETAGFSYDASLTRGAAAYYPFVAGPSPFAATLAWNARITAGVFGANPNKVFGSATLASFSLAVLDPSQLDAGLQPITVAVSKNGTDVENSENLYLTSLVPGHAYLLKVNRTDTGALPAWDFGLAWRGADIPGDANADGVVNAADLAILAANLNGPGGSWALADFNHDGLVDVLDLAILARHYGGAGGAAAAYAALGLGATDPAAPDPTPAPVPEPASLALLLAVAAILAGRPRNHHRNTAGPPP
jgi:hypothetical protein